MHRSLSRDHFKAVIAAARGPEFEQATVRTVVAGLVLMYLLWYVRRESTVDPEQFQSLAVVSGYLAFSLLLALWLVAAPHLSVSRRLFGIIGDNAAATYCVLQMGEGGAIIVFVYFFFTFGNGMRYGRIYLHASQLISLVAFSVVFGVSPFWSSHPAVGIGFLIGLMVLPLYVAVLIERVNVAPLKPEVGATESIGENGR